MNKFILSILIMQSTILAKEISFDIDNNQRLLPKGHDKITIEKNKARGHLGISEKSYIEFNLYKNKYKSNRSNNKITIYTPIGKIRYF